MRFDKSNLVILFVIIAIITLFNGEGTIQSRILDTLLSLPGLIVAISLHEFAHARKAVKLGDPTPKMQGRLNISPLSHLDPVGTICLLFGGFGWGRPVEINPTNFKNPEKDGAKVAAAGPIMNFVLSIVFAVIYGLYMIFLIKTNKVTTTEAGLYFTGHNIWYVVDLVLVRAMILNLGLGLFNLLPFPPLDGSKIYRAFLRGKAREFLYNLEQYSMIIIAILFITGIASYIISPIINWLIDCVLDPIVSFIISFAL